MQKQNSLEKGYDETVETKEKENTGHNLVHTPVCTITTC